MVGTPGSEAAIAQAGVPSAHTFVYDAATTFQPAAFRFSRAARAAHRWGFDRVAVLWNDPSGSGQGNVDRTAFWLAPRGFVAVTPDGRMVDRSLWPHVRRQSPARRGVAGAAPVLGVLFVPALAGRLAAAAVTILHVTESFAAGWHRDHLPAHAPGVQDDCARDSPRACWPSPLGRSRARIARRAAHVTVAPEWRAAAACRARAADVVHILFERCAYRLIPALVARHIPYPWSTARVTTWAAMFRVNEGLRWQADESLLVASTTCDLHDALPWPISTACRLDIRPSSARPPT